MSCLINQHRKSPCMGNAPFFRLPQEGGIVGVINQIHHPFQVGEVGEIHRGNAIVGEHTHRGGIDNQLGILVGMNGFVGVFSAAGYDADFFGSSVFQHTTHGTAGSAAAQNQSHFVFDRNTAFRKQLCKSVIICIVAVERTIRLYRARFFRKQNFFGAECNRFFIRNGYIQPRKNSAF